MNSKYTIINASAGSGKTYTLVQRLLMICLDSPYQQDAIRHIIALTFTNKAANEMKERILEWLGKFTSENYAQSEELIGIQQKFKERGKNISLEELHRRSKRTLDYILHHYSTLNIGTIDKFNYKLVRAFSYELGLAQNFNLDIQAEPYLIEAVDQMLHKIGSDERISDSFMDFVEYNLDNEKRTNLSEILYSSAKKFVNDVHYEALLKNKNFDWNSYETIKTQLRKELHDLEKESRKITEDSLKIIKEKGLQIEDFSGGKQRGLGKFFTDIHNFLKKQREGFPLPANEESAVENYRKGASAKSKDKEDDILEILDFLLKNRSIIIQNQVSIHKKEKTLQSLLPLRVNKDIQDELEKIEEEKDLVLLSKFNILINENLKNEPSAFIYEKVGTQYFHYFFDEFQDTSALQWQNFLPLRDHTVSSDQSSFTVVGDPKQSIYRFRGGDSEIMLNIIEGNEFSPVLAEKEVLEHNFRSAKNIVQFNNELYYFISKDLQGEHQKLFGKDAQQIPQSSLSGQVRVNLLEGKKDEFYQSVAEKMTKDIQQCLDNGFSLKDICILCRGNSDIFTYSQLLGNQKVNYQGQETFIKTISESGLTLNLSYTINAVIQFLNWTTAPKNKRFLVMMFYFLNQAERIKIKDFTTEVLAFLELDENPNIISFIQEKYNLNLNYSDLPRLNLYNFIEHFINEFSVENKEKDFLLNFLEMTYNFTQNSAATMKDFLRFWEEEGQNTSIQASESVDAIKMMTIHKAKGLEFPVVLLPIRINSSMESKFEEWFALPETHNLHSINISGFDSKLEDYDEEISAFNQENKYKSYIDRLCIQYVATTRPVEQLFLYLEKQKESGKLKIYDFVQEKNTEGHDSFNLFTISPEEMKKQRQKTTSSSLKTMEIPSFAHPKASLEHIQIATPSKSYQKRKDKVRIGILIHDILAKINHIDDLPKVLEEITLDGGITLSEKELIAQRISLLLQDEEYAPYFGDEVEEVLNEREMLITLENGEQKLYRPDRIIKNSDGYIIIDFKTGDEKEKYETQIQNYQSALERLGKKVIGTKIIYLV